MANEPLTELIVENLDGTVNTEVINITNSRVESGVITCWTTDSTAVMYAIANFRSLTLAVQED